MTTRELTTLQHALRRKIDTIEDFTFIEDGKRMTPVLLLRQAANTAEKFARQTDELLKLGLRCHELVRERRIRQHEGANATAELFKMAKNDWYDRVFGKKNSFGRRPKSVPKSIQVYFSTILRGLENGVIPGGRYKLLPDFRNGKVVAEAEQIEIDNFNKLKRALAHKTRQRARSFAGSPSPKSKRDSSRKVERGLEAAVGDLDLPQLRKLVSEFSYLIQEHLQEDSEASRLVLAGAVAQFGDVVSTLRECLPQYQQAKNKRDLKVQAKRQMGRVMKEVSQSRQG